MCQYAQVYCKVTLQAVKMRCFSPLLKIMKLFLCSKVLWNIIYYGYWHNFELRNFDHLS